MLLENVIQRDDRASQPAANTVPVGTLYYVTDEEVLERSNGVSWDSYSTNASGIQTAEITLTNAQILALDSAPQTIVAAPGAGFVVIPLHYSINTNFSAGAYGSSETMFLDMGASSPYSATGGFVYQAAQDRIFFEDINYFDELSSALANLPLVIKQAGVNTGGNAANTARVKVWYVIEAVLP